MIQYQVYLVIESVDIDEQGETVPDSREEEHCEVVKLVSSEEAAYSIVEAMQDAKDSIERIAEWFKKE